MYRTQYWRVVDVDFFCWDFCTIFTSRSKILFHMESDHLQKFILMQRTFCKTIQPLFTAKFYWIRIWTELISKFSLPHGPGASYCDEHFRYFKVLNETRRILVEQKQSSDVMSITRLRVQKYEHRKFRHSMTESPKIGEAVRCRTQFSNISFVRADSFY